MAEGHRHASRYSLAKLSTEAAIVHQRKRHDEAARMNHDYLTLSLATWGGTKAKAAYDETVKELRG